MNMENVYKVCPQFEDENYLLRQTSQRDKLDLLKVYSDKKAVPYFNSDNCGELFHRDSDDFFTDCGLLRLDIRSDYEISSEIIKILTLIIEPSYSLFHCNKIATKAIPSAVERMIALKALGFKPTAEKLTGHDGTQYSSYFILNTKNDLCTETRIYREDA